MNEYYASNYQFHAAGTGNNIVTWNSNVTTTASYDVYVSWAAHANRASNAKYTVNHTSGSDTVTVNQQINGAQWNLLGTYTLDVASTITLSDDANGYVIADGLTTLPAGTPVTVTLPSETATWALNAAPASYDVYATWTAHPNRASNAEYTVTHAAGSDTVTVNQQQNGGEWNLLGTYTLDNSSTISLSNDADGYVIADGIKLVSTTILPPTQTAGLYYVHNDHLGTPQTITDQNQAIAWQAVYNPFGEATIITSAITNNVRFPGQYYDEETNLHYNYFRYYDPTLGRYITSDPIGLAGGVNTFGYVGGNPLVKTDFYGLLEDFTFDTAQGSLTSATCACAENVDAFSGDNPYTNDTSATHPLNEGPLPPGQYYIVEPYSYTNNPFSGYYDSTFFKLYRNDGSADDSTTVPVPDESRNVTRGQFRFHPGTVSYGCLTVSDKSQWKAIQDSLLKTETAKIPGTNTTYYGTVNVK